MFRFNHRHQGAYYLSFDKDIVIVVVGSVVWLQPHHRTNYNDNHIFIKAQIIRSLMTVIKPKHVGAVLM